MAELLQRTVDPLIKPNGASLYHNLWSIIVPQLVKQHDEKHVKAV